MNLPKLAYVEQITVRFFSMLQFSCNQSIYQTFDGNKIDMLVTINEPIIVIQLKLGIREQKKNQVIFINSEAYCKMS